MYRFALLAALISSPCLALTKGGWTEANPVSHRHTHRHRHRHASSPSWTAWVMFEAKETDDYADIFDCWASTYMKNLTARSGGALTISCLSEDACLQAQNWTDQNSEALSDIDVTVKDAQPTMFLAKPSNDYKLRYFPQILDLMDETGKGVLHTDLDAFWVGDVETTLAMVEAVFPDADMIYSMGGHLPQEAHDAWGFALCNGVALYRNTPPLRAFLLDLNLTEATVDEQSILNMALLQKGCTWSDVIDGNITSSPLNVGQCGELNVILLPGSLVTRSRTISADDTPVIIHPFIFDDDKMDILRKMGLCT